MQINEKSLREKGWSNEEINHAKQIIENTRKNKFQNQKHHKQATYWFLLIMLLGMGIGGTYLIGAFVLFVNPNIAYLLIGITGTLFGIFAGIVVKDIEDLERHHHLAISIIIPITSIIGSLIMSNQVLKTAKYLGMTIKLHPLILGIVFSICILIPYEIFIWLKRKDKNESN